MTEQERSLWKAISEVRDPELPIVGLVEMGMVHRIALEEKMVMVEIIPHCMEESFLDWIQKQVTRRFMLEAEIRGVEVHFLSAPPWTWDRVTELGKAKLEAFGINNL